MRKVKITKVPSMAWGGRIFNQVAPNALPYQTDEDMMHYNDTLQPVDRNEANLEAEKDEEVLIPNYKGMSAKFRVGGKRHYEGGTPLNLPDDSFVFSDTKAMKIKDPNILKIFGKPAKKGGYTPAELAKPYDINKHRKVLDDPMSDAIQKKTAEEMIANYNVLLGKLALAQESKKGFPQGIPFIAEPYMMMNKVSAEDVLPMPKEQGMQGMQAPQQQMQMNKYGGAKKVKIKQLPKKVFGGDGSGWDEITGQAILSANPNEGQIVDISTPNDFSNLNWDTGKNNDLTFNSMVDKGFYEKPIEMDLKSERPGIDREVNIKEKIDKFKPKSGLEAFAKRQVAKDIIGNIFGNNDEKDPMLAYRTMEDTMTGIPTSKGTFDPLNKNNFPYKNDYATYDPFTYSAAYGGALPRAQKGQTIGVGVLAPEYLPSEDQATADAMMAYLPGTQAAAANAAAAAAQQAATVQQNVQAAQAPVAQPAAAAAPAKAKATTTTTTKPKKTTTTSAKSSTDASTDDLITYNQDFWDEYNRLGKQGAFQYDIPKLNFTEEERIRRAKQKPKGQNIYGDLDWSDADLLSDFKRRHAWYLEQNPDFDPHNMDDVSDFQRKYCEKASQYGMKSCYFLEETDPSGKPGTYFDGKFGEHTWSAPGFNKPAEQPVQQQETKQEDIKTNPLQQPPNYNPFEYYPQDVLNLMTAMGSKIPDPQTFYSNLAWQAYSPAYVKEDYSPIMEAANIATQGIGAYGSRQSADASYSGIQGKAARQAADHNLQVANLNVGIYNDAEKFNAQTREKNYMYNQMQKQQNFDTEQAYMADRVKAKNEKRANVASLYNQMLTNAVDTYNLNSMNPNYKILPGTGGRVAFVNPEMLKPNKDALTSARLREYRALLAEGLTHDQAIDVMGRQSGKAAYPPQQQYPYSNPYDYTTGLNYYES
jgi:hypothetical protein